jgi:hypothetical protein
LKTAPICCPETSVENYHYSLRNNPEERSYQLPRSGGLQTRNNLQFQTREIPPNQLFKLHYVLYIGTVSFPESLDAWDLLKRVHGMSRTDDRCIDRRAFMQHSSRQYTGSVLHCTTVHKPSILFGHKKCTQRHSYNSSRSHNHN